jgi:3-hydroxyacyl-[acyl-carrier-protein] dehydratase
MRWFWIDKFVEFECGRRAVAIKNVSYAEEQIPEYSLSVPMMPTSLIIEGLAQTGGLLAGASSQFRERVVLAKLGKAVFYDFAEPGDTLRYTAELQDVRATGAMVHCTVHRGEQLLGEVQMVFAHLDDRFAGVELFSPLDFLGILRSYRVFEVGKDVDGSPLRVPPHLLEFEQAVAPAAGP